MRMPQRRARPIEKITLADFGAGLLESSLQIEAYFRSGLKLGFASPEEIVPVLLDLTRQQGPGINRCLSGWLRSARGTDFSTAEQLASDVNYFQRYWHLSDGIALLNATLTRLVRQENAEKMLAEALLMVNRKSSRHTQGYEAHNRSVQQAKEGARAKRQRRLAGGQYDRPPRRKRLVRSEGKGYNSSD